MQNYDLAPSTQDPVVSILRQEINDLICELQYKKQEMSLSLQEIDDCIEKFVKEHSWFNSSAELILKIDSDESWKSIISHPDTPGLLSYFYLFVRETEGLSCSQSVKCWKSPSKPLSAVPRALPILWKRHRYEFVRYKLDKLHKKWIELLNKKEVLQIEVKKMEENEQFTDKILNTYEAIVGKKEESQLILKEISKNNENLDELKRMITSLEPENYFNYKGLKKLDNEIKYEALDIFGKENKDTNLYRTIKLEDQKQPPFTIGNIRSCLDEIRKAIASANRPMVNSILADVFIIDSLGVKSALGRTHYQALTSFNPLSEDPPLSTFEAINLTPRIPNFKRNLTEWELQTNTLSWEFRLNFAHLTVYDLCLTLKGIQEGTLNFDFSIKYQNYYPWSFNTLTCPPGSFLSPCQKSHITNLIPNCRISTSPETNSSVIQIFPDNAESVIFNRQTKVFKKYKPVDFSVLLHKNSSKNKRRRRRH